MSDDVSSVFEKFNIDKNNIPPDIVNNLLDMLNNSSQSSQKESNNSYHDIKNDLGSQNNIDFDTILKMKSIIDKINAKDDPRSNLLESLKPYLKENRKNKIDQYIQLMNMSKIIECINMLNGDNKNVSH